MERMRLKVGSDIFLNIFILNLHQRTLYKTLSLYQDEGSFSPLVKLAGMNMTRYFSLSGRRLL